MTSIEHKHIRAVLREAPTRETKVYPLQTAVERESAKAKQIRALLDEAHWTGRRFWLRIQLPLMSVGVLLVGTSVIIFAILLALDQSAYLGVVLILAMPGCICSSISISHSDRMLILVGVASCYNWCVSWTALFSVDLALQLKGLSGAPRCVSALPALGEIPCWFLRVHLALDVAQILIMAFFAVNASRGLAGYLRGTISLRELLDVFLSAMAISGIFLGASIIAYVLVGVGGGIGSLREPYWLLWFIGGGMTALLLPPALLPNSRTRLQAFLAERSESVLAAAGIASHLGSLSMDDVMSQGKATFRSISLEHIAYADLSSNTPSPTLYLLSRPCRLQECDAFLSHSWSDDPQVKWDVLRRWRGDFVAKNGREARVWLDKCCLDQRRISDSIALLPVYLAGCRTFVALAGPTYLGRLWTVVECFVFLEMGGDVNTMELLRCSTGSDAADHDEWMQQINTFDVRNAVAFTAHDRERLLATISAGFFGPARFNASLREALAVLADRSMVNEVEDGLSRRRHSRTRSRSKTVSLSF